MRRYDEGMSATIDLGEDLLALARQTARRRGKTVTQFVRDLVTDAADDVPEVDEPAEAATAIKADATPPDLLAMTDEEAQRLRDMLGMGPDTRTPEEKARDYEQAVEILEWADSHEPLRLGYRVDVSRESMYD